MTKRTRLTKFEFATLFLAQGGYCGCGCQQKMEPGKVDEEHTRPVALLGEAKPDSLWRRDCHKAKTKADVKRIAKAARQKRHHETGRSSGKKRWKTLQGRGFEKTLRKKMNGTVERKAE